jgi:hypothetical protein
MLGACGPQVVAYLTRLRALRDELGGGARAGAGQGRRESDGSGDEVGGGGWAGPQGARPGLIGRTWGHPPVARAPCERVSSYVLMSRLALRTRAARRRASCAGGRTRTSTCAQCTAVSRELKAGTRRKRARRQERREGSGHGPRGSLLTWPMSGATNGTMQRTGFLGSGPAYEHNSIRLRRPQSHIVCKWPSNDKVAT